MATARHAMKKQRPPSPRPRLRLIVGGASSEQDGRKPRPRRSEAKASKAARSKPRLRFVAISAFLVLAQIFGLVLLNIYIAQNSFRQLDLQAEIQAQDLRFERTRFEVARAESPDKVAAAAAGLGLVIPQHQEFILGRAQTRVAAGQPFDSSRGTLKAAIKDER